MRLTITRKLALAFGALHVLMAGVAIVAVLGYATAGAGFRAVREAALNQEAAGNLRFALAGLLAAVNDFIITDKDEYRRDYEAAPSRWSAGSASCRPSRSGRGSVGAWRRSPRTLRGSTTRHAPSSPSKIPERTPGRRR
jgi:hypothetical protein